MTETRRPVNFAETNQARGLRPAAVDRVADHLEFGVDRIAERAGAGDDGECDQGGDQAILDGGRAGFVADETGK